MTYLFRCFMLGAFFVLCGAMIFGARAQDTSLAESRFILPDYSKRVTMDFKNADLEDVLKLFSKQTNRSFIASDEIGSKKITLYLDDVPVEEALDRILSANALTFEIDPDTDILIVKPIPSAEAEKTITRVFTLKYATVPSSKINSTLELTAAASTSGSGSGIVGAVQAVMSTGGTLIEDPRTNSLIITDLESKFEDIEEAINNLDIPVAQILIEVEMIDTSKTTTDLLGAKLSNTLLEATGGSRQILFPWERDNALAKGRVSLGTDEFTTGVLSATGFRVTLNFLNTQSDTKNLARPRLLTMNNETAEIKISTNEAIGLATTTSGADATATSSLEAERVDTGVFLTVTPQANLETGEILMAIVPKVIQARTGITVENRTFKDPEERGSQSILKVKSGETIMLGGLLRDDESVTQTKVPILGSIPFLGKAFRHEDKLVRERELLIFITPHILTEKKAYELTISAKQYKAAQSLLRRQTIENALSSFE